MDDLISRQGMYDSLNKYRTEKMLECKDVSLVWECIDKVLQEPSAQPDRSLWFRIGEICVDESKGFISSGRAVEKIRELLREAERKEECTI